jgi:hypothetical protein
MINNYVESIQEKLMFQESENKTTFFHWLATRLGATKDGLPFPPAQSLLHALSALLDQAEIQRIDRLNSADPIPATVPGRLSALNQELLPFARDPVGTALRLGIRRLGEIAAGFMTIDQMAELLREAASECGDQGVREVIVDKAWDGLRDHEGSYWIA